MRQGMVLFLLFTLLAYFSSESDRFLQPANLTNILQQNVALIIVTVGMTLTMLIAGIDLSVGSVAALAGALSSGFIVNHGMSFEVSVVLTLAIGFSIGLINGSLIVWGKLPPFIATLAMLGIARGLTLIYTEGRPIALTGIESYTFFGRGTIILPVLGETPVSILVAFVVVLTVAFILAYTRFGLHVYALGGSEETSRLAGLPVKRITLIVYGSSSGLAALAGMLLTARLFSAQPQAAVGLELNAIAAAVLGGVSLFGGVGNIFGAVIGGLFVGVLSNGMNFLRLASFLQQMIQGGVLVFAVALDMIIKRLERASS